MHVRRVVHDRVGDLVQEDGLAGAGRRHDQPALAAADGGDQVGDPHLERVLGRALEDQPLLGIEGHQLLEGRARGHVVGAAPVDRVDLLEGEVLLALAGGAQLAGQGHARPQPVALDEGGRDEGVVLAGQVGVRGQAQERVAVGPDLEAALGLDRDVLRQAGLGDGPDEVAPSRRPRGARGWCGRPARRTGRPWASSCGSTSGGSPRAP